MLLYLGKEQGLGSVLPQVGIHVENGKLELIQLGMFFAGLVWTGMVLPIKYERARSQLEMKDRLIEELLEEHRQSLVNVLRERIQMPAHRIFTRLFFPRTKRIRGFRRGTELVSEEIPGLTDKTSSGKLIFGVDPVVEGIVGQAYLEGKILIDFDAGNVEKHNLNPAQELKIGAVQFCAAVPIFDEDSNENIIGVMSLDSEELINSAELSREQREELEHFLKYYGGIFTYFLKKVG